jgi:NADH-quinone oxidoreductase subunit B
LGVRAGAADVVDITVDGCLVRLNLHTLGLACCGIEVRSALRLGGWGTGEPMNQQGGVPDRPVLNLLLIAGTITLATEPLVRQALEHLPVPRKAIAFGACAISGGPYWDSYAVVPGAPMLGAVDLFVPGCPPRPQDLLAAVQTLASSATAG